ncbi:hypothetical protein H2200_009998 [Cladophialophora chaetospira]|uniref:Uncharacterized protein n=1 Tax=Cladophialophora chaetospira TaxID=386627 RepID=A0AA38X1Z5_9EURO|nr:hypothetical protein H2200_009998 [Cladophialophora chaetospira]
METNGKNLLRLRHQYASYCNGCEPRCLTIEETKQGNFFLIDEYVILNEGDETVDLTANDSDGREAGADVIVAKDDEIIGCQVDDSDGREAGTGRLGCDSHHALVISDSSDEDDGWHS